MNSQFTRIVLSAAVSVLIGTQVTSAQDNREVATIPFAFEASQQTLTPGQYTVVETGAFGLFRVYDATGRGLYVTMVPKEMAQPGQPKLTFICDGNRRLLAKVQTDSGQTYGVTDSTLSKELSRRIHMAAEVSVAMHR